MIFELPIRDTYIPEWGVWEAIREAVQNGLDEDDRGYPLTIEHTGEYLRIFNQGADMDVKALLIGHTDKLNNPKMRGSKGEGLDLCFLAGVRAGIEIQVITQSETWKPCIEFSDNYGVPILKVQTRKRRSQFEGVEVRMGISKDTWEETTRLFLSLRKELNEDSLIDTKGGAILLDDASRGMLYVKGIFVQKREDFKYGYNLKNAKLDRDRRIIDDWDLKYEVAQLYADALQQRPDVMVNTVYNLIQSGAEDVRGMGFYSSVTTRVCEELAAKFLSVHGENAVPVKDIAESEEMDHIGKTGVVVSETLSQILKESKIDTPQKIKEKRESEVKARYSWQELTEEERANLKGAAYEIETALKWATEERCEDLFLTTMWAETKKEILSHAQVVDFHSESLEGIAKLSRGTTEISRKSLKSKARALRVLIHEEAHILVSASGDSLHGRFAEELWTLVYACKEM